MKFKTKVNPYIFKRTDLINIMMIINILCCLYVGLLTSFSKQFYVFNFIPDLVNIFLLILIFMEKESLKIQIKRFNISDWFATFFIIFSCTSFLWGPLSLSVAIKRYRYILAAFLTFYCCKKYVKSIYLLFIQKILFFSMLVNTCLVIYQNKILKLHPDFCNGIFGFTNYCNAMQGIFCLIIALIGISEFLEKGFSKMVAIVEILLPCIACAYAEIKVFFVLFVLGGIIIILPKLKFQKLLIKILGLITIGFLLSAIVFLILLNVMPENLYTFVDLHGYISYETYGARGGAGRLNQIRYIYENVFFQNMLKAFFGTGLGRDITEYAYEAGKLFVNFGIVGVSTIIFFYFSKYVNNIKISHKHNNKWSDFSKVYPLLIIIATFVWNCTLNRMCYLVFFFLAIDCRKG